MVTKDRMKLLINSKPKYVVYWHHLIGQTDPLSEGYIGVTNVSKYGVRFSGVLKNRYKRCRFFLNAINKYGEQNINTVILYDGLSKKEANDMEYYYRPKSGIGWNIRQGGGNKGALSESTKNKISNAKKGKNHLYYDKIFTSESREKIRKSKLGNKNMLDKKHTEETKKKMSLSNKGVHENTIKARFKKTVCVESGTIYNSQIEAQKMTGINHKYISACCSKRQKTAGGLHWKLYEEKNEE